MPRLARLDARPPRLSQRSEDPVRGKRFGTRLPCEMRFVAKAGANHLEWE